MINNNRILKTGALFVAMMVVFAIFAVRVADWTRGLSSDFIAYGQASTGSSGTSGSTGSTGTSGSSGTSSTKVVAQIVAGPFDSATYYVTVIEIVNPNTSGITITGNFYNEDGTPSTLTFATNLSSQPTVSSSFTNMKIPAGSILVLSVGTSTPTLPATGKTIWGSITGSNTISVSSFFELRSRGDSSLYSRVGIASSARNMTSFLIPRIAQTATASQAQIDTGFAVVNTGSNTATITATLYDANGNRIASTSFPLGPNSHKAGIVSSSFSFLNQQQSTARQYQYMLFTSTQPTIGAAAIAFEGVSLTSFPVTPIS